MKHTSAAVLVSTLAGLAAAQDGWWFGRDQPRCADDCYRSYRKEAPTAYCTDTGLASSVDSCLSSACSESTQAIETFEARTSSVCSVYSGCRDGATQTLTITRGSGRDWDGDEREPRTTTATVTGCPGDGRGWGWAGNGWGWGWGDLDRDGDGDLDRDDWRDWCRGWGDGYRCRTTATTVTVTAGPSASDADASLSTRVETILQAVSGDVTQGTTVQAAAPEETGRDGNNDGGSAGSSVNVQFAGLALGLFVAVAGLL
jgi:hypothetical protein